MLLKFIETWSHICLQPLLQKHMPLAGDKCMFMAMAAIHVNPLTD